MNKLEKIKKSAGIARANGSMLVASTRNRVHELKKNKSKYVNAWKKEARLYA